MDTPSPMMPPPKAEPATEHNPLMLGKPIPLSTPIQRGDSEIKEISLMKPIGASVTDVSLFELMRVETNAIVAVLPRISQPPITVIEANMMSAADLFRVGQRIFCSIRESSTFPGRHRRSHR
jgi:hypothetical protein